MSDVPQNPSLARQLAGRWQIPLLLVAMLFIGAGVWRLRPVPKPPDFEPLYAHAIALQRAELYPETAAYINKLLANPERTEQQKRRLYGLLARAIFARERTNAVHSTEIATRIIEYTDASVVKGDPFDSATLHIRGVVSEWLRKPWDAVAAYRAEILKGVADPWALRRRILEIRLSTGDIENEELLAECETFVKDPSVSDALAYWAAEQIVDVLSREKKHAQAEQFLAEWAERFRSSSEKHAYDYLQALIWFHLGRREDSERLLRAIRDDLEPGDATSARAGLLLARMLLDQRAPEYALAFFDDVVRHTPTGSYRWVAVLGRADALYDLQRISEALEAYGEAARLVSESPYEYVVETSPVGEAISTSLDGLLPRWRFPTAAAYLRIYGRRADLALELGKQALNKGEASGQVDDRPEQAQAKKYLMRAGEHYLALAGLVVIDDAGAAAATMKAAEAFDMAGERERTAEVLDGFIHKYADNTQVPEALLRAGQAYQALGDFEKAIFRYQENLTLFPRTPAAIGSLVPLAECFVASGNTDKAEQTLLRLLEHAPGDPLGMITPAAVHYRDALFGLADLYTGAGEYEKAVTRYEEAIQRYRDDPRVDRATFMLAEGYRHSAGRIRKEFRESQSLPYAAELARSHRERLDKARRLYTQIIERYGKRPADSLSGLDQLYLRLSHLYAADSVFETSMLPDSPTSQPTAEALDLYEQAARACAQDPIAMSAYVQIINCNLSLGRLEKARMAVQRARWALRNIPDAAFRDIDPKQGRDFWEEYLTWLEKMPTLAATRPAEEYARSNG